MTFDPMKSPTDSAIFIITDYILWGMAWPPAFKDEVAAYKKAANWVRENVRFDITIESTGNVQLQPTSEVSRNLQFDIPNTSGFFEYQYSTETTSATEASSMKSKTLGFEQSVTGSVKGSSGIIGGAEISVETTARFNQEYTNIESKTTSAKQTYTDNFTIHIDLKEGEKIKKCFLKIITLEGTTSVNLLAKPKQNDPKDFFEVEMNYGTIKANLAHPYRYNRPDKPSLPPVWKDELSVKLTYTYAIIGINIDDTTSKRISSEPKTVWFTPVINVKE